MSTDLTFSNNVESVLADLANNLRTLIDLRYRVKQESDTTVIDMRIRRMQDKIKILIAKHQQLIGPAASFLTKHGEEATFNEYHALAGLLAQVEADIVAGKENSHDKRNSYSKPR